MSKKIKDKTDEIPFEEALEKLEKIVEGLEAGTLGLDESLKAFENGMALAKLCENRLSQATTRVEKIVKQWDGNHLVEKTSGAEEIISEEENEDDDEF